MKIQRIILPEVLIGLSFFFAGACATPNILLNHNPEALLLLPVDSQSSPRDFKGAKIILQMEDDFTLAPTGGYLDDNYGDINPVNQSYVISKPGLVLFEHIAENLGKQNAKVYRKYFAGEALATKVKDQDIIVSISLIDFEFHCWKTPKAGTFHLGRANLSYQILRGAGAGQPSNTILQVKVPADQDLFEAMARKFSEELHAQLDGGGQG